MELRNLRKIRVIKVLKEFFYFESNFYWYVESREIRVLYREGSWYIFSY